LSTSNDANLNNFNKTFPNNKQIATSVIDLADLAGEQMHVFSHNFNGFCVGTYLSVLPKNNLENLINSRTVFLKKNSARGTLYMFQKILAN
jgi:hypothetical protein